MDLISCKFDFFLCIGLGSWLFLLIIHCTPRTSTHTQTQTHTHTRPHAPTHLPSHPLTHAHGHTHHTHRPARTHTVVVHGSIILKKQACSSHAGFALYLGKGLSLHHPTRKWKTNGKRTGILQCTWELREALSSVLLFQTKIFHGVSLPGDGLQRLVNHLVIRGVRSATALETPKD